MSHSFHNMFDDILYLLGSAINLVIQHLIRAFEVDHHWIVLNPNEATLLDEIVFPLPKPSFDIQLFECRELVKLIHQNGLKHRHIEELTGELDMPDVVDIHR